MSIIAIQQEDGTFTFSGRSYTITKDKNMALAPFGKQLLNYGVVLRLVEICSGFRMNLPSHIIGKIDEQISYNI